MTLHAPWRCCYEHGNATDQELSAAWDAQAGEALFAVRKIIGREIMGRLTHPDVELVEALQALAASFSRMRKIEGRCFEQIKTLRDARQQPEERSQP